MRRVVITGMGGVSAIGNNVEEMFENAKKGVCGIDKITSYDTENQKVTMAGEVKNLDIADYIDKKEARKMARFTQLGVIAATQAFTQSGLDVEKQNPERMGCIIASGIGGLEVIANEHARGTEKGFDRVSPLFVPMSITNMAAGAIGIRFGLKGVCTCVVTACAASTNAIGEAFHNIRHGYHDVILAGGAESCITPFGIGGFTSMRALNETTDKNRASIPFDKERSGFVMGEGAGVLVLEDLEHAQKRGATILAEVVGYGATCDAYHMTAPCQDGNGAARCMQTAISDAGILPSQIDYINAHGTSTPLNDKGETMAIKTALGEHANKVMVSSTKSMTGHLLGASGAVEAILTTKSLQQGVVLPTINYKVKDEDCDLDIVPNTMREVDIKYALSNSLGFGGHNASIVLKKYE